MDMKQIVRYEAEFDLAKAREGDFEDLNKCLKERMKIINMQLNGTVITFVLEEEKKTSAFKANRYPAKSINVAQTLGELIKNEGLL